MVFLYKNGGKKTPLSLADGDELPRLNCEYFSDK
jgi:hypothetical protein